MARTTERGLLHPGELWGKRPPLTPLGTPAVFRPFNIRRNHVGLIKQKRAQYLDYRVYAAARAAGAAEDAAQMRARRAADGQFAQLQQRPRVEDSAPRG